MKISKQKLLKIINEEVSSVLLESRGGGFDPLDLRSTVSFYEKLFPDFGFAGIARHLNSSAHLRTDSTGEKRWIFDITYGPHKGKISNTMSHGFAINARDIQTGKNVGMPRSGPRPDFQGVIRRDIITGILHKEAAIQWWKMNPKGPKLTTAGVQKAKINHLEKVIPDFKHLSKKQKLNLAQKLDELFYPMRVPERSRSIGLDIARKVNKTLGQELFGYLSRGMRVGALALVKPTAKGGLSLTPQSLPDEAAEVARKRKEVEALIKDVKPGEKKGWMSRLSRGIAKLGGRTLGIAGIGLLWDECEGDLECLAINMMTLVPVKVEKENPEIVDIEPSGRFDHILQRP